MEITGQKIKLRDKLPTDARRDYQWETDPEISRRDARAVLLLPFSEYQERHRRALANPRPGSHLFAIIAPDGAHVGNCMYFRQAAAEEISLGIIIGRSEYWGMGYGRDAVNTLVSHVFETLDAARITLRTLTWNQRARRCFDGCGFSACGEREIDGQRFIQMELTRDAYLMRSNRP